MNKHSFHLGLMMNKAQIVSAGTLVFILALGSACTNEAARRSAVDPKRLCDPANPYSCLSTEAASPSSADTGPRGAPKQNNNPVPDNKGPAPAAVAPAPADGAPAPAAPIDPEEARAKAQAEALKEVGKAVECLAGAIGDNIRNQPAKAGETGGGGENGNGGQTAGPYLVVFSKDSFVGIATGSVKKNCFVTSGTAIEVNSAPAKVTEFASQGVNQFLARGVVSV